MLCCLWYKVAYKTNTFWNWKQRTTVKAFEDALQYIEMHVLGFYPKLPRHIFKMSSNKSFDLKQGLEQFIVRLTLKVPFEDRPFFKNEQTLELLVPKVRTGSSFYLRAIYF